MLTQASYLKLLAAGELGRRVDDACRHMEKCDLCARRCRVNRHRTISGAACHTGERALVYRFEDHCHNQGECASKSAAGAIFFSYCNLNCIYCNKREVSHKGMGWEVEPMELANMMLALQEKGSRNISLVSPSHVVAQILAAVHIAAQRGLRLPLIYESDGYDSLEALALLDGVIDVYAPDIKYGDARSASLYSHAPDYIEASQRAVKEMHRQVGDLHLDEWGEARHGLLVRHLLLPGNQEGALKVLEFVAGEISPQTTVCILPDYRPCHNALGTPPLDRALTEEEFQAIADAASKLGLRQMKPFAGHHAH